MGLQLLSIIDLPEHQAPGGFDHAAMSRANHWLYVAHTANNAVDIIDCAARRYDHSIPGLSGVAGTLVSDENNLVFTSNRGENTVGIFTPGEENKLIKVPVGIRPNGLSYDPNRNLLLAANVGDPAIADSFTVSIVDVAQRRMVAAAPVAGRTRWTTYDPARQAFYVNIMAPAQIAVIESRDLSRVKQTIPIPFTGPHGLDLDAEQARLFCACDSGQLVTVDIAKGAVGQALALSGAPDVIFFNAALHHLYVAVGDPGVIDVFDTHSMQRIGTIPTSKGAHTLGFDPDTHQIYAFLPETHSAQVYQDEL